MKEVDFIIVGQGIAGTAMAFRLLAEGKSILIIDEDKMFNSSKVSSGILNPITGRRYVKSWKFDDLFPEALAFYKSLEDLMGISVIEKKKVYRGLENVLEENLWYSQSAKPDYEMYFGEGINDGPFLDHFKKELKLGEVKHSRRINLKRLMAESKCYFEKLGVLRVQKVSMSDLQLGENVQFEDYVADSIIFAEGYEVIENPLFNDLGFTPSKGEILICEIDNCTIADVVKAKKFIVPLGGKRYWIGTTNQHEFTDEKPDESRRQELIDWLDEYVNRPYRIIDSMTGIRPSTKFRKPLIGQHPNLKKVFLFNGLGTKGASLGPYYSRQLTEHILYGKELDDEVNIARFFS